MGFDRAKAIDAMGKRSNKIANLISTIGHPLMLGTVYVIFISFYELEQNTAWIISGLIIGLVTVPIIIHNWIKLKNGSYSNFDVSDQQERIGFYPFTIALFTVCFFVFFYFDFPKIVVKTTVFFTLMLCCMAVINFRTKASLHLAIALFIATKILSLSLPLAFIYLAFAFLIGWSRWYLGRHTQEELLIGSIVGGFCGWLAIFF